MPATDQFRIASDQFGYLMYFIPDGRAVPVTDRIEEVAPYDQRDSRETKLKFWRGYASGVCGLDPACVQIVEAA